METVRTEKYIEHISTDHALIETQAVRKHFNEMIQDLKASYETQLAEKDKLISTLKGLISSSPSHPPYGG